MKIKFIIAILTMLLISVPAVMAMSHTSVPGYTAVANQLTANHPGLENALNDPNSNPTDLQAQITNAILNVNFMLSSNPRQTFLWNYLSYLMALQAHITQTTGVSPTGTPSTPPPTTGPVTQPTGGTQPTGPAPTGPATPSTPPTQPAGPTATPTSGGTTSPGFECHEKTGEKRAKAPTAPTVQGGSTGGTSSAVVYMPPQERSWVSRFFGALFGN